ncbi:hypothetical protein AnigIFM63604_006092 [Aspergillus niger]|uniref:Protein kinase domain-containing protein n=1 Tax=Aspergillus niger TaxID=5061 RepID=A0A9W6A1G0_ASPNG|nr:hypothetical protein AnigIFM63604_006092 [Aspergillus niger]
MKHRGYVTLKIFIKSASMGKHLDDEIQMYKRIERCSRFHAGRNAVRRLLDSFDIDGPEGKHRCLVHPPLWESVRTFLHRNPVRWLPVPVLSFVLKRVFLALDYLHTECQVIHTAPILCDFGSAVPGDIEHSEDIQPDIYRAPEVILEAPWGYKVDIWNVGCMIWDVFEGGSLFTGYDPEFQAYRSRAHLAEIIRLLGPPPPELLAKGRLRHKFFSDDGDFLAQSLLGDRIPLEDRETSFEGLDKTR